MDWQIRIALIIAGIGVIGFIVFDYTRRKKIQAEKKRLIDKMRASAEHVDSLGFDANGVGTVRKSSEAIADDDLQETPKASPTEQMDLADFNDENDISDSENTANKDPEHVISLILKADTDCVYRGQDFMPLLLSQGLRHGEMGIFHRHSHSTSGKPGATLYSIANAINPGTFDIANIENFETPAFAFFMALPGPKDPIFAFDAMVKTIKLLKQELGGQILDETKSVYTEQTHQHKLDSLQEYLTKASLKQS